MARNTRYRLAEHSFCIFVAKAAAGQSSMALKTWIKILGKKIPQQSVVVSSSRQLLPPPFFQYSLMGFLAVFVCWSESECFYERSPCSYVGANFPVGPEDFALFANALEFLRSSSPLPERQVFFYSLKTTYFEQGFSLVIIHDSFPRIISSPKCLQRDCMFAVLFP